MAMLEKIEYKIPIFFFFAYGYIAREICFGFSLNFVANVKENCLSYNYLIRIVYYLTAVEIFY